MNIFNSLGSNYSFKFVLQTLFSQDNKNAQLQLKTYLKSRYNGEVVLVYKGREAITLALKSLALPPNSTVVINGYTCYAVYEAIKRAGFLSAYLDVSENQLNFSPDALLHEIKKNSSIKVVVIQNTLGYPCDIESIAKICKEHKIVLVEDLAHSIGTQYTNGVEAGIVGDMTILSFSQDKVIDGISGGALIVRNPKFTIAKTAFVRLNKKRQKIDRWYPLFTFLIRKTYFFGMGKVLHALLKKANLLSKPMDNPDSKDIYELPGWYCRIIYQEFLNLQKNLMHRKQIAKIYAENLNKKIISNDLCKKIDDSVNLRFPVFVSKRSDLVAYLKNKGVFVSDIWYDAPIAPKKYLRLTDYDGQCPEAEKISEKMINLPTHRNINKNQAKFIAGEINEYLKA